VSIQRTPRRRDVGATMAALIGVIALGVLVYAWTEAAAEAEHWRQLYVQLMEDTAHLGENVGPTTTVTVMPEDLGRVTS